MASIDCWEFAGDNIGMVSAVITSTADAGATIYELLRPLLEPAHRGKYVVIDVDTGAYELDADHLAASDRAHAKSPNGRFYVVRIGIPFTIGRAPRVLGVVR